MPKALKIWSRYSTGPSLIPLSDRSNLAAAAVEFTPIYESGIEAKIKDQESRLDAHERLLKAMIESMTEARLEKVLENAGFTLEDI